MASRRSPGFYPSPQIGSPATSVRGGEVAEQLAVGAWRIYQLCEDGELPPVRINNSIRVRPKDLEEFIASKVPIAEARGPHRRPVE